MPLSTSPLSAAFSFFFSSSPLPVSSHFFLEGPPPYLSCLLLRDRHLHYARSRPLQRSIRVAPGFAGHDTFYSDKHSPQRGRFLPHSPRRSTPMAIPFYDRVSPRCGTCRKRRPVDQFWKWYAGRFCYRPFCTGCEPSDRPVSPEREEVLKERAHMLSRVTQFLPNVKRNPPAKATCPGCKRLLSLRSFHPKKVNCALCKECAPNAV